LHRINFPRGPWKQGFASLPLYGRLQGLSEHDFHHFTFYCQYDMPIKAESSPPYQHFLTVYHSCPSELGYGVISEKQITTTSPSRKGSITTISLPLFLLTLAHSQKSHNIVIEPRFDHIPAATKGVVSPRKRSNGESFITPALRNSLIATSISNLRLQANPPPQLQQTACWNSYN